MKRTLTLLALSALPMVALGAGNHAGAQGGHAHDANGHAASTIPHAATPVGQPGDPANVTRSIEITMDDTMRFTPSQIQVGAGETIRFVVKNAGKLPHEMVIGSMEDLKAHAAEMQKTPGMQHAEPTMITLGSGKSGELVWKFDRVGAVDFACLIPGHLEAGMVGKIKVGVGAILHIQPHI